MKKIDHVTKKDVLSAIATIITEDFEVQVGDVTVTAADVINYVDVTIAQIDHKNEKAKERADKRKVEGDTVRDKIEAILTNEYKTIKNIIDELGDEDLTPGKVSARMGQLCKLNRAHRTKVKDGNRNITAYAAGPAPDPETETETTTETDEE